MKHAVAIDILCWFAGLNQKQACEFGAAGGPDDIERESNAYRAEQAQKRADELRESIRALRGDQAAKG